MAPVILRLQQHPRLECRVTLTGQHRELLDDVLTHFGIEADRDLDLMRKGQSPASFAAQALSGLGRMLAEEPPELLLVQGDTSTVFCAALAAFYQRVPVAHVEAGLRSGSREAPWPEEMNRRLTTRLASLHFAPTTGARDNLQAEGVPGERIFVTGNTVVDAVRWTLEHLRRSPCAMPDELVGLRPDQQLVLITCHRREHLPVETRNIFLAAGQLARRHPQAMFVCPAHPNPEVRRVMQETLGKSDRPANLHLIDPLPYPRFIALLKRSTLILTDSGGLQEEAPGLGKPVLVLRSSTERPEAVDAGSARLVGTSPEAICRTATRLLEDPVAYREMAQVRTPFGNGRAAERIVAIIAEHLEPPLGRGKKEHAASSF